MRALWSLVVVCLVAATSARDPVDDAYRASNLVRTAQTARANANRATERAATDARASVSLGDRLPPSLAAIELSFRAPNAQVLSTIVFVGERELAHVEIPSCSARGPPIV